MKFSKLAEVQFDLKEIIEFLTELGWTESTRAKFLVIIHPYADAKSITGTALIQALGLEIAKSKE